ncbi:MAG: hypothetical protein ABSD56_10965 [Bryobacteraceae bacterium]
MRRFAVLLSAAAALAAVDGAAASRATGNPQAAAQVSGHTMLLEPSGGQLGITESFFFTNPGTAASSGPAKGSLRFFVPEAARGSLRVAATAPGGAPVAREAAPAGPAGVYRLDFPSEPGETRIDITYSLPFTDPGTFSSRVFYKTTTRLAVPSGVTLEGDGLKPLGHEPSTQAALFETASAALTLRLTGTGSFRSAAPAGGEESDDSGPPIRSILPPGFEDQRTIVLALTLVVLALGFALLYQRGRASRGAAAQGGAGSKQRG